MKKYYTISLITIIAIAISAIIWEHIKLPFDSNNILYGEYSKNLYNHNNDTLRFIFFIFFPLLTFFLSYLYFFRKNINFFKKILFFKKEKLFIKDKNIDNLIKIFFHLLIITLVIEFLCLDLKIFLWKVDYFHEGIFLTSSKNFLIKGDFWISSFVEHGFLAQFMPSFIWKTFQIESIGIVRFYQLLLLLFNKILLVCIAREISINLSVNKYFRISYFIILSITSLFLVQYIDHEAADISTRYFIILLFLFISFKCIYIKNKYSYLFFLIGLFSVFSILWYIDMGAYINALLFFILVYLFIRKELKLFSSLLFGVFFGWFFFISILPLNEFNIFIIDTLNVYSITENLDGLIYPTPFFSGDARSTKALLLILFNGIMLILLTFNKNTKFNIYAKHFLFFVFMTSVLIFRSALARSDSLHIKQASGITLFLFLVIIIYYLHEGLSLLFQNKNFLKKLKVLKKFSNITLAFIIFINFFAFNDSTSMKNLFNSFANINKYINYENKKFLGKDYLGMINFYKDLTKNVKCIQIFTNETALPYLLNKPSCSKFFLMWTVATKNNQEVLIDDIKLKKPEIILFDSEVDPYRDSKDRLPIVYDYINENYIFHSKYESWTFVQLK